MRRRIFRIRCDELIKLSLKQKVKWTISIDARMWEMRPTGVIEVWSIQWSANLCPLIGTTLVLAANVVIAPKMSRCKNNHIEKCCRSNICSLFDWICDLTAIRSVCNGIVNCQSPAIWRRIIVSPLKILIYRYPDLIRSTCYTQGKNR